MFYDVLWCFMGNEPSGWNRMLPPSLYWLLHRPSRVKLFRNFRTQPSRAAAPAWRMESMKYHGILKILESGMVNGCHTTNINQPQKTAIASSWHSLHCFWNFTTFALEPMPSTSAFGVKLPPSDDLPCATLPAMVGDPLPALPTVKLGVAQSAHSNHCILFLLPKLSALWWCSRFFMVFHYLLTQKSTSLSRGAWPPQPPQWQLPWWRTLFVGTQVPLGVRLPSALPEDDKRICKKIDLKKWGRSIL